MITTKQAIGLFPDTYEKRKTGNLYKLLDCWIPELRAAEEALDEIAVYKDIDTAFGKTLDMVAYNVGQLRGGVTDEILHILIRAKIAANQANGTIPNILDVVGFIFDTDSDTATLVNLYELWQEMYDEPAAFNLSADVDELGKASVTLNQFVSLIAKVKSAGVRLEVNLTGTFITGETHEYGSEYSTGFSDDEQTVGGTLGFLYSPDGEKPLPI